MSAHQVGDDFEAALQQVQCFPWVVEVFPITGFGIFELKESAEQIGCNPQTGELITIAVSKSVNFNLAVPFKRKEQLNDS